LFELGKFQEIKIPLYEPGAKTYVDVLNAINKSFEEWKFDESRPKFYVKDGKIYMHDMTDDIDDIRVKLPDAIAKYFGFHPDTVFVDQRGFDVSSNIVNEERRLIEQTQHVNTASDMPIEYDNRQLVILLDILENQIYGEIMAPILAQIPWDLKSDIRFKDESVVYLPLNSNVLSYIRVQLTNEQLATISSLTGYTSVIKLHFRPRFCH